MPEYIYESIKNGGLSANEGIIVLPDIYCQTDYSKRTVEEFAGEFNARVLLLDYFYISSGQANNLDGSEQEKAHTLMNSFDANKFPSFFEQAINEIEGKYPALQNFTVIGFCFGGRLAYVAGASHRVERVISFYGGGANTPNYVEDKSPIEYLISKRSSSANVVSFFGTNDPSIPIEDREKIKVAFSTVEADYKSYEYEAGHAYFQEGRKNFNEEASQASWEVLRGIFK